MNTHRQHAVDRRILNNFWEDSGGIPGGFRGDSEGFRRGSEGFRGIPHVLPLLVLPHRGRPEVPLL